MSKELTAISERLDSATKAVEVATRERDEANVARDSEVGKAATIEAEGRHITDPGSLARHKERVEKQRTALEASENRLAIALSKWDQAAAAMQEAAAAKLRVLQAEEAVNLYVDARSALETIDKALRSLGPAEARYRAAYQRLAELPPVGPVRQGELDELKQKLGVARANGR